MFRSSRKIRRARHAHRFAAVLVLALASSVLVACGAKVTVPNVVGMRLDSAHRAMQKLGVHHFDDVDVRDKRNPFLDHGWVVVKQSPAAGTRNVDADTKVRLTVGKASDHDILELIPANSPFAKKAASDARKEAAKKAKQKAKDKADTIARDAKDAKDKAKKIASYAKKIDPIAVRFAKVLRLYDSNAEAVFRYGGGSSVAASNALAAKDFFSTTRDVVITASPPSGFDLGGIETDMAVAAETMVDACKALLVVIDTDAPSAIASAQRDRDLARAAWADAMRKIYRAAGRKPVLPPH